VTIGIEHPGIRFEIVYGVSGNKRAWYDNSNAARLGYRPSDDSETYAAEVLANEKPGAHPMTEKYQGGMFVVSEDGGDPFKTVAPVKKAGVKKAGVKKTRAKKKT
jgi:uronate dehydrogenase